MIETALIFITLFALWQWHRKRVWKRRFDASMSQHVPVIVNAFATMWANDYREKMRSEWPDEIETK